MLPSLTILYPCNRDFGNTDFFGDAVGGFSFGESGFYFAHFLIGKFSHAMSLAFMVYHQAMFDGVLGIAFIGHPLKIFFLVVLRVAVNVIADKPSRARANKRLKNKGMDGSIYSLAAFEKGNLRVSGLSPFAFCSRCQQLPRFLLRLRTIVSRSSIQTSDSTKVGNFVKPFISYDRFPLFLSKVILIGILTNSHCMTFYTDYVFG